MSDYNNRICSYNSDSPWFRDTVFIVAPSFGVWHLFSLVLCIVFLIVTIPAHAGGISVRQSSVHFIRGQSVLLPRSIVNIQFHADEFMYGSRKFVYVLLAVVPDNKHEDVDEWDVYGVFIGGPNKKIELQDASKPFRFSFQAPEKPGKYKIIIANMPYFSPEPIMGGVRYKEPFKIEYRNIRKKLLSVTNNGRHVSDIIKFEVSGDADNNEEPPPVYLRVNEKIPGKEEIVGGVQDKPIVFSWKVGSEFKKDNKYILYRYQLLPDEDEWSAWSVSQEASYTFLLKGVHQFRVQAKYDDGLVSLTSNPATSQFMLAKDLVARPTPETLSKAPFGSVQSTVMPVAFDELYPNSHALLVGIWGFDDPQFTKFEAKKISSDVSSMEAALRRNGFKVTTLSRERVSRDDITDALQAIVDESGRDDRILVYFSTHGFPDPNNPSVGYLATSDCKHNNPDKRCLRLNDLQDVYAERALKGKLVRQVLFVVDSCFSGLGVVRKSVGGVRPLNRLAVPQGAFMLTAGMADQEAGIDPQLNMSTFTHYLAEGLKGQAEILKNNGLITLAELHVYVQYMVAGRTQGKQIPMLSRMWGDGEMLFMPNGAQ